MSAPQLLAQAVLNRLTSRLGSGLADAAASLAVLAREAPERLQQDWELFWEEVQLEAERLDGGTAEARSGPTWTTAAVESTSTDAGSPAQATRAAEPPPPQDQIDQLRALVAGIARRLEERP